MSTTLARGRSRPDAPPTSADPGGSILVACPDARPPAYQAAIGLAEVGRLDRFVTGFYHKGDVPGWATGRLARVGKALGKRHDGRIPGDRVESAPSFDAALAVENRLAARGSGACHAVARWRTRRFDQLVARAIERRRPAAALIFSDVGSEFALPTCRRLGIPAVLSMVHGDVREEQAVLDREARFAPDFFPIYLGDGKLDRGALDWLHRRRLVDLDLADRILVPSDHIAATLARFGTPRERIRVIPYAADLGRFRPLPGKRHDSTCTFLFAGGITQRKGIKYLLEAWRRVRRPGWRLQLVGALPSDPGPLAGHLGEVEHLGRVGHGEMPALMAAADAFVFPSLFEGSAVVTYEALASGLPVITTTAAGSVARDGVEGSIVGPGDALALALAMERLGSDPALRAAMAGAARTRAEAFGWDRYQASLASAFAEVVPAA